MHLPKTSRFFSGLQSSFQYRWAAENSNRLLVSTCMVTRSWALPSATGSAWRSCLRRPTLGRRAVLHRVLPTSAGAPPPAASCGLVLKTSPARARAPGPHHRRASCARHPPAGLFVRTARTLRTWHQRSPRPAPRVRLESSTAPAGPVPSLDLTVIIPAMDEAENLAVVRSPDPRGARSAGTAPTEIVVVAGPGLGSTTPSQLLGRTEPGSSSRRREVTAVRSPRASPWRGASTC